MHTYTPAHTYQAFINDFVVMRESMCVCVWGGQYTHNVHVQDNRLVMQTGNYMYYMYIIHTFSDMEYHIHVPSIGNLFHFYRGSEKLSFLVYPLSETWHWHSRRIYRLSLWTEPSQLPLHPLSVVEPVPLTHWEPIHTICYDNHFCVYSKWYIPVLPNPPSSSRTMLNISAHTAVSLLIIQVLILLHHNSSHTNSWCTSTAYHFHSTKSSIHST